MLLALIPSQIGMRVAWVRDWEPVIVIGHEVSVERYRAECEDFRERKGSVAMKTKCGAIIKGVIPPFIILALCTVTVAGERQIPNRSLYIPVKIRVCEHLEKAILYQDDQAVAVLPAERILMFTYYSNLERLVPEVIEFRVEGVGEDGEPFKAKFAATPDGIFTAHRKVEFDTSKVKKLVRFKVDVHYKEMALQLKCETECARSSTSGSEDAKIGSPPERKSL